MGLPNAGKMAIETEAISLLEHLLPRDHIDILRANVSQNGFRVSVCVCEREINTFLAINVVAHMHKESPWLLIQLTET